MESLATNSISRLLYYLQQDKNNINLLLSISDSYVKIDDWANARLYLDRARQRSATPFWFREAILFLSEKNLSAALHCFSQALTIDNCFTHRYYVALTQSLLGQYTKAIALIESDIEPHAISLKARLLFLVNKPHEAIKLLQNELLRSPSDAQANGLLSLLYFLGEDEKEASAYASKALREDAQNYDAQLVHLFLYFNQYGLNSIKELLLLDENDSRLWFALGVKYLDRGQIKEAKNCFERVIILSPEFEDCQIYVEWCKSLLAFS